MISALTSMTGNVGAERDGLTHCWIRVCRSYPEVMLSDEDEGVAGDYLVRFRERTQKSEAATVALDGFHREIPIRVLDDFVIQVMMGTGEVLVELPDATSYQSDGVASIEKDD